MGIELILVAAVFVAMSNLCFRRSIDSGGTAKPYLVIQLFITFLVAILLNPVRTGQYEWSPCMAMFGLAGGVVLAGLMICFGKALETGPPGLTVAALSSSTVMPVLLMVLFFGAAFGYMYTLWNGIGSVCVVIGLFWAGWQTVKGGKKSQWAAFVIAAFAFHVIFLVFMQWRALFINFPGENGLLLTFDVDDALNQWFMPMIFLAATIVQFVVYVSTVKRLPNRHETMYGVLGGITNGLGTFFLIWSTEVSTSLEHAMIFPIYSVGILVLCNIWGQWLYKEKVNWKANGLCVAGILLGTLDWGVLLG